MHTRCIRALNIKVLNTMSRDQFVAYPPDIDNRDRRVSGQAAAKFGNENMQAAGIEVAVVAPQVEQ